MRRRRSSSGFTLVETLVAIAILSGVLVAAYAALSQALATAVRVRDRDQAVQRVAAEAAALRSLPASLMRELRGETPAYRWHIAVTPVAVRMAARHSLVAPYRLVGVIIRKAGAGHPEVVLDTVILGHAA